LEDWKEVWNNEERIQNLILDMLIKVDGFDTRLSNFTPKEWLEYTKKLYRFAGIKDNDSIFEVGCGAGAFLYPLLKTNEVGGVDFSQPLINLAKNFLGDKFIVGDALEANYIPSDFTISNGVFLYFTDLEYSKKVIEKMFQNSNKIVIFDINDLSKKEDYLKYRKKMLGKNYNIKFTKTQHLFYDKEFFVDFANKYNLKVFFQNQLYLENYQSAQYRFNVRLER
jgi:SAM-dependent methyltransferase